MGEHISLAALSAAARRRSAQRRIIEAARAGLSPIGGGMPSGVANVKVTNAPQQAFRMDPPYFDLRTERNKYRPIKGEAVPIYGGNPGAFHERMDRVGVIAELGVLVDMNLTIALGGGTAPTSYRYPWSLFRFRLSGNQQTNFINVDGLFLYAREVVTNPGFKPVASAYAINTGASGATEIKPFWKVPVAMDLHTLTGALYAQGKGTALTLDLDPQPPAPTVFSPTGAATITPSSAGGITVQETFYQVVYDSEKKEYVTPRIDVLHGFTDNKGKGTVGDSAEEELDPFTGQLERLFFFWDRGDGVIVPSSAYTGIAFNYGGNQEPLEWSGDTLQREMAQDIRDVSQLPDGLMVIDLVRHHGHRDVVNLDGLSAPSLNVETAGVAWGAKPRLFVATETLFR